MENNLRSRRKHVPLSEKIPKSLKSEKTEDEGIYEASKSDEAEYIERKHEVQYKEDSKMFRIKFEMDILSILLFICSFITRMYKLDEPRHVVFDELHYGKYVSLYMKNTFFFDAHPPLGKQLLAAAAYMTGYDGKFKFDKIGSPYPPDVPIAALRFVPAFFGSLIIPVVYHLMLEVGLTQSTSLLTALLLLFDNALLTQSRFILLEPILLFFSLVSILFLLKFVNCKKPFNFFWFFWLSLASFSLTCALSVKYVGFYSCLLGAAIILVHFWKCLPISKESDFMLCFRFCMQAFIGLCIFCVTYLLIFYIHLNILYKAGPHDSIMTSAFQASLEGGLASITKGQPLQVAHGSQITLRHSHGRTCWLHSHSAVYPVRYPDGRGSSHQQQVTCYSFKDVNNWWIVKRPDRNDLRVEKPVDGIKHGDVVQLVHGITSRALNSHDVAAPMSPQCQEVSCYIDYNISMPAQNLWKVDIINREQNGDTWHTIQSLVRLIHVDSNTALKFTGKQLPDWGFHQHEVAADRTINQDDTIWNVEEHRYTKSEDQKERERDMVTAEMIPMAPTKLSFWQKFLELHYKMLFSSADGVQNHMYSSEPLEWPLMTRGIAYWVSPNSNAQVHLLGNIVIWYSATLGLLLYASLLIFYLLRRRRQCYDIDDTTWTQFKTVGEIFMTGYLLHYLPYFFVERTLFLHHYLPAFVFKTLLFCGTIEHVYFVLKKRSKLLGNLFILLIITWFVFVIHVFKKFSVFSYGTVELTTTDIVNLRWRDTWDFIIHKN